MSALTPAVVNDIFRAFPQSPPDSVSVGKSQDQFSTGGHPTV
jgi:hypothetical protein